MTVMCSLSRRNCDCALPACRLRQRIAKLMAMLGSSYPNEVAIADMKLRRLLTEENISFVDVAIDLEKRIYLFEEMQEAYQSGLDRSFVPSNERSLAPDFFDDKGRPRWLEIAGFCRSQMMAMAAGGRFTTRQQEMFTDIAGRVERYRRANPFEGGFLLSTLWQIRGSLT
jgi:hypothetical protein